MFHITIDTGEVEKHEVSLTLAGALARASAAWHHGAFSVTVTEYDADGKYIATYMHQEKKQ